MRVAGDAGNSLFVPGRVERRQKRLSVLNVTGLLLACFIFRNLYLTLLSSGLLHKKICQKEGESWWNFFSNIVITTLVTYNCY